MEISQARRWIGAVATGLHHSHSNQIQASSATYTIAHSNVRSLTHWTRPGIEPVSSWMLVRFVSAEPRRELWSVHFNRIPGWLVCTNIENGGRGDRNTGGAIQYEITGPLPIITYQNLWFTLGKREKGKQCNTDILSGPFLLLLTFSKAGLLTDD